MGYEVTQDDFEALVAAALDEIPPELGREIENVAVVVDDWPPAGSRLVCRSRSADRWGTRA